MVDYSRFDKIDISDDEEEDREKSFTSPHDEARGPNPTAAALVAHHSEDEDNNGLSADGVPGVKPMKMTPRTSSGRIKFEYEGRTVYEWEQSLNECNIYIQPPAGVTKQMLDIQMTYTHLRVGLKGAPPFIDEDIFSTIVTEESYWMLSDGELNINLQKMKKGEVCFVSQLRQI